MMGSPIVFHTAPPQPSSNAFATWTYVFVGGPLANQNGLGLSIPAKFTRRSAIVGTARLKSVTQRTQRNRERCCRSLTYRAARRCAVPSERPRPPRSRSRRRHSHSRRRRTLSDCRSRDVRRRHAGPWTRPAHHAGFGRG